MKHYLSLLLMLLISAPALAFDLENGESVYEESSCVGCHASGYDADGAKARNFSQVKGWVMGCNNRFNHIFPDDEMDVTAYLVDEYYGYTLPEQAGE